MLGLEEERIIPRLPKNATYPFGPLREKTQEPTLTLPEDVEISKLRIKSWNNRASG